METLVFTVEASIRLTFVKGNLVAQHKNFKKTHIHFGLEILLLEIYTNEIIKDIHKDLGTVMLSTGCLRQ